MSYAYFEDQLERLNRQSQEIESRRQSLLERMDIERELDQRRQASYQRPQPVPQAPPLQEKQPSLRPIKSPADISAVPFDPLEIDCFYVRKLGGDGNPQIIAFSPDKSASGAVEQKEPEKTQESALLNLLGEQAEKIAALEKQMKKLEGKKNGNGRSAPDTNAEIGGQQS